MCDITLDFCMNIHYNLIMTAEIMRLVLLACFLSMVFTAAFFLRRRRLSLLEYATWGLIAILLPVVGPFLVIWIRPGRKQAVN